VDLRRLERRAGLTWQLGEGDWRGVKTAIVWLYVMFWTSLGVEACATFAPEYRRPAADSARALRASALFSLGVFVLLPLGLAGAVGEGAAARDPVGFYAIALDRFAGGAADTMLVLVMGGLLLVMNTSMADSSRALRGMAAQGMTIRGLAALNRRGAPSRALAVDLVANLCLILLLGDLLAILAAGNLGYVLAHVSPSPRSCCCGATGRPRRARSGCRGRSCRSPPRWRPCSRSRSSSARCPSTSPATAAPPSCSSHSECSRCRWRCTRRRARGPRRRRAVPHADAGAKSDAKAGMDSIP
jgi:hypothetical protein